MVLSAYTLLARTCLEQDPKGYQESLSGPHGRPGAVCVNVILRPLAADEAASYHPGWDCHGLPIENKVLKELGVRLAFE